MYFTALSCVLYIGSSTFLATSVCVYSHLYYFYREIPGFAAYPALTAVYVGNTVLGSFSQLDLQVLGYAAGTLHGVDSVMAVKFMRSVGTLPAPF